MHLFLLTLSFITTFSYHCRRKSRVYDSEKNVRILNQIHIKSVKLLQQGNGILEPLPEVDIKLSGDRYKEAVQRIEKEDKCIRDGVTEDVQALFDSLAKQYNCEWRGANNMIFMKDLQLVVEAPYKPENCTGNDAPALEHLKKVLSGMRAKLNMNENK